MIELKPCPFCGGEACLYVSDGIRVICKDCEASSVILCDAFDMAGKPYGKSTERVIEAWNRRVTDDKNNH